MTFKKYIKGLTEFLRNNPEAAEYKVVFSSRDRLFHEEVLNSPSLGIFNNRNGFYAEEDLADDYAVQGETLNAVCIN